MKDKSLVHDPVKVLRTRDLFMANLNYGNNCSKVIIIFMLIVVLKIAKSSYGPDLFNVMYMYLF